MNAYEIHVPAKWHFQGILIQGGNCVPVPFGVFRTTSLDGLTFVEQMPTLGWAWGTGPGANVNNSGCLPLRQAMGAQDFLKYLSGIRSHGQCSPDHEIFSCPKPVQQPHVVKREGLEEVQHH